MNPLLAQGVALLLMVAFCLVGGVLLRIAGHLSRRDKNIV